MARFEQKERRITEQLVLYWQEKRAGRLVPSLADMDQNELAHLAADCYVLTILPEEEPNYRFHYVGPTILETVHSYHPQHWELVRRMVEPLADVLSSRTPKISEAEFSTGTGNVIKFRQIMLPLSENGGETISHVFCGTRYREDALPVDVAEEIAFGEPVPGAKGAPENVAKMPAPAPEPAEVTPPMPQVVGAPTPAVPTEEHPLSPSEQVAKRAAEEVQHAIPEHPNTDSNKNGF